MSSPPLDEDTLPTSAEFENALGLQEHNSSSRTPSVQPIDNEERIGWPASSALNGLFDRIPRQNTNTFTEPSEISSEVPFILEHPGPAIDAEISSEVPFILEHPGPAIDAEISSEVPFILEHPGPAIDAEISSEVPFILEHPGPAIDTFFNLSMINNVDENDNSYRNNIGPFYLGDFGPLLLAEDNFSSQRPPIVDNKFLMGNKLNLNPLIANVISTPTRPIWIQKLESYKEAAQDTASTCIICDKKDEGDFVILLECTHLFCTSCIKNWFGPDSSTSEYSCGLCRAEITECVTVDSIDDVMTKLRADAS